MNLKELRVSKGLSQKDASFFLSIPLRTYKRLENEPNYSVNSKYSYALNKLKDYKKDYFVGIKGSLKFEKNKLFVDVHSIIKGGISDINED